MTDFVARLLATARLASLTGLASARKIINGVADGGPTVRSTVKAVEAGGCSIDRMAGALEFDDIRRSVNPHENQSILTFAWVSLISHVQARSAPAANAIMVFSARAVRGASAVADPGDR